MIRPSIDGNELVFAATASPTLERRLHSVGGHRDGGQCRVPLSRILDFEDALGYGGIEKSEAYKAAWWQCYFGTTMDEQITRATILHQDPGSMEFDGLRVPLYPYQARAVRFLTRAKSGILGDEPGLGKTLQAIAWAMHHGPTLVVCPAGVAGVWEAEVPGKSTATVSVLRGTRPGPVPTTDFVVASYSVLHAHAAALRAHGFNSLIIDEAHAIKDPKAQRSKAVAAVAATIPRRLFLSGTLLLRGAEDLYPILRLLRPDDFSSLGAFRARYARTVTIRTKKKRVNRVVGSQHTDELRRRLEPWMAARRLSEVVEDLPELTQQTVNVELLPSQHDRYRTCIQHMRSMAPRSRDSFNAFRDATRILQEAKTAAAAQFLDDLWFTERKALVFSHHLEPLEKLETKPWMDITIRLTGAVPAAERTRRVKEFQTNPRIRLALCQLEAAGVGITLDAADTVLMVDPGWTPALVQQAIRRARRVNTKHPVHVIHFRVPGTLDDARWQRMEEREQALGELHGVQSVEQGVYEYALSALLAEMPAMIVA